MTGHSPCTDGKTFHRMLLPKCTCRVWPDAECTIPHARTGVRAQVQMTRPGASLRQILSHYYPNTTIVRLALDLAAVRYSNPTAEHLLPYPGYQTLRGSSSLR